MLYYAVVFDIKPRGRRGLVDLAVEVPHVREDVQVRHEHAQAQLARDDLARGSCERPGGRRGAAGVILVRDCQIANDDCERRRQT